MDASPSQSSPTERTRPVACSPWRKLLVYSVCGTLLARLGRDCSRGSTTMFSSFADLAFPKQNCSLAKSHCVPRPCRHMRPIRLQALRLGSPEPTGRLFAEASTKSACFHKHLRHRFRSADAISVLKGGDAPAEYQTERHGLPLRSRQRQKGCRPRSSGPRSLVARHHSAAHTWSLHGPATKTSIGIQHLRRANRKPIPPVTCRDCVRHVKSTL